MAGEAALIEVGLDVVIKLIDAIGQYKAAAAQSGEWTPAQEDAFKAKLDAALASPAWQTDAQLAAAQASAPAPVVAPVDPGRGSVQSPPAV